MKFEVPQRQQLASGGTPLTSFAPASSTISFVPLTRNLSLADPSPYSFEGTRYRKRPPMVRDRHSVRKTASYGTRRIFRSTRCAKTGFYGTEEIFGVKNSLLWYATHLQRPAEQPTPQTVDSLLWHAMRFQGPRCMKPPPAAPDASSVRGTVSARRRANIKRGRSSKSIKTF